MPIPRAFYESNCVELFCSLDRIRLGRAAVSGLRGCLEGKRQNFPVRFGGVYGSEHKDRIAVVGQVHRRKREIFSVFLRWFRSPELPPKQFGTFSDFVNCLSDALGDKEATVAAVFSYDRERVESIFSPIHVGSEAGIFDEIVGFTGVKRSAEGKPLYTLEVGLGPKRVEHVVTFFQTIRLSEELPLSLLETASKISNLGLKKRA